MRCYAGVCRAEGRPRQRRWSGEMRVRPQMQSGCHVWLCAARARVVGGCCVYGRWYGRAVFRGREPYVDCAGAGAGADCRQGCAHSLHSALQSARWRRIVQQCVQISLRLEQTQALEPGLWWWSVVARVWARVWVFVWFGPLRCKAKAARHRRRGTRQREALAQLWLKSESGLRRAAAA